MAASESALRLALVGLGKQGLEHLLAAPRCRDACFVAAVDPQPEARAAAVALQPGLQVLADPHGLAALDLDGLVLALPHHVYVQHWPELLALRLPLLKEKPLGRNLDEARALLDAARVAGCPVQTAIQRRHHPSYRQLAQALRDEAAPIREIHAHMHLGFPPGPPTGWRAGRDAAGGGALLDAGYHLVDVLHYIAGPFDLVSAVLWTQGRMAAADEIDERAWLLGKSERCWVKLDCWVSGEPDPVGGKPVKSERVVLRTEGATWQADRETVWRDGVLLGRHPRDWEQAMADQLDAFAGRVLRRQWHDGLLWDQIPAMRVIDAAYALANRY